VTVAGRDAEGDLDWQHGLGQIGAAIRGGDDIRHRDALGQKPLRDLVPTIRANHVDWSRSLASATLSAMARTSLSA